MVLDYPLQIEISLYMLEIQISVSVWKEERKERILLDCLLQIQISVYVLSLTSEFILVFSPCFGTFCFCLNSESLLWCKFLPLLLFLTLIPQKGCPRRDDVICCFLSWSGWVRLDYVPPRSILVITAGMVSVAILHGCVILHCIYVRHLLYLLICPAASCWFSVLAIVSSAAVSVGCACVLEWWFSRATGPDCGLRSLDVLFSGVQTHRLSRSCC